jgi:hypothetical protein
LADYEKISRYCALSQTFIDSVNKEFSPGYDNKHYEAQAARTFETLVEIAFDVNPELRPQRDAARAAGDSQREKQVRNLALDKTSAFCAMF